LTANDRYRGLHAFSKWLEAEEDFVRPMRKLKPPKVPDQPVPVIDESELERLLAGCLRWQGPRGRRDRRCLAAR
jgi:hypothetical protein